MNAFAILALILLALVGNIFWFWLKNALKKRGYKTHLFRGHFNDLFNAADVIMETEEQRVKQTYRWVLFFLVVVIILMPTIFFMNIESTDDWRCRRFNDYLNHQVSGVIESKYIDKPNHSLETLNLADGTKENEITIFATGLYEFLQPGDSIYKISGNPELKVYRTGKPTSFIVNKADYCGE